MSGSPLVERLFDNGIDSVAVVSADWTLEYWNEAMEAVSGVPRGEALGRRLLDLVPDLPGTDVEHILRGAFDGEGAHRPPPFFLARDAEVAAQCEWFVIPVAAERSISAVAVISRSLTRAGHFAGQAAETDAWFRAMADSSPVLLWMSGPDSLCNFFNSTWLEFSGRTLDEELGVGWVEGVHPADFEACMGTYTRAFAAREPFEMEYRLRRHDGEFRWLLDRGVPRFTSEGVFAGFIGSCVDITDRRNAEEKTRKLANDLERANAYMERLLYAASHDLREPVRMVGTYLERLEHHLGKPLDEAGGRYLQRASEGATRMQGLIDGLLEFARIRAQSQTMETTSLDTVVRETLEDLAIAVESAGAAIRLGPLPSVRGEPVALRRLFQNLLANSLKFRRDTPLQIRITAEMRAGEALVVVEDNGIGFEEQYAERIFDMFQRLHDRQQFPGMGVGLALAQEIVERHGGRLWAEGKPGVGAVFRFTLPLA